MLLQAHCQLLLIAISLILAALTSHVAPALQCFFSVRLPACPLAMAPCTSPPGYHPGLRGQIVVVPGACLNG